MFPIQILFNKIKHQYEIWQTRSELVKVLPATTELEKSQAIVELNRFTNVSKAIHDSFQVYLIYNLFYLIMSISYLCVYSRAILKPYFVKAYVILPVG